MHKSWTEVRYLQIGYYLKVEQTVMRKGFLKYLIPYKKVSKYMRIAHMLEKGMTHVKHITLHDDNDLPYETLSLSVNRRIDYYIKE